jgi:hypothetical protein
MEPQNPNSRVTLDGPDEYTYPRAFVSIKTSANDDALWKLMDEASDEAALVFANGNPYEVLVNGAFTPVAAGTVAKTVLPFAPPRRDGLGTTHHEAGTLAMSQNPAQGVTDPNGRFHHVTNTYAIGPALFPSVGSPNPMLTGIALTRRLGDHLIDPTPAPYTPSDGFTPLFDGMSLDKWRMSTINNQPPEKSNPGGFLIVDGTLESTPGNDLGLLWHTDPMPQNYILRLSWLRWTHDGNSGVFVRFPDPRTKGFNNTAYVAVLLGFEIQIDELAAPDGADIHRTGAVYREDGRTDGETFNLRAARPAGQWNDFEIRVEGDTFTVFLNPQDNPQPVCVFQNPYVASGRGVANRPTYIGLQSHFSSRVAFKNIRFRPLP